MAPQPKTNNLLKLSFREHCSVWVQTILIVTSFLLIMLTISTFHLMSGIKIDPAYLGLNIAAHGLKR